MKHSAYATLITGSLLVVAAAQGATVAYWNFEDGVDGKPFNSHGANSGSYDTVGHVLMRGYDGHWGSSFSADNLFYNGLCMRNAAKHQDGYVTEGALHSWAPTNWTIECTARLDELLGWNTLIGRDGSSFGEPESDFYLQNNGLKDSFRLNYKSAGGQRVIIDASNVAVQPGQWYGLAVVSDGNKVRLYIDDRDGKGYELEGSAALTNPEASGNALAGSRFTWTFGRGWYNGNYVDHINGAMDNIRFSDTALTPAEFIPVPVDPFLITYAPTKASSETSQTIEATIVDEDSDFSSAILLLDGTPVATNNTPSGSNNSVSYAAEGLHGGTHTAEVVVAGINPSVTATQRWNFAIIEIQSIGEQYINAWKSNDVSRLQPLFLNPDKINLGHFEQCSSAIENLEVDTIKDTYIVLEVEFRGSRQYGLLESGRPKHYWWALLLTEGGEIKYDSILNPHPIELALRSILSLYNWPGSPPLPVGDNKVYELKNTGVPIFDLARSDDMNDRRKSVNKITKWIFYKGDHWDVSNPEVFYPKMFIKEYKRKFRDKRGGGWWIPNLRGSR